ncbi:toll-like receptor 6 isoform X1 [Sabethes cyaneus]|uniref:toll-like receptor 6 isoform X1 n=1 Tax=Sabethes cyaneus TaxID=53552 RepID=UPI00237EBE58|nr:toll-like receptor 6 isoform X1 [Sabethes cyaneus]
MYRHRFKIVCFCVLISTVFSYELRSSTPGRNQYNQETPDSSGANTNGGSFISYPKETSNSPYNPSRTGVSPYYGTWNTASRGQPTGHQQTQTQMDPNSPQQAINPQDAQGYTLLVKPFGGGAKTTTRFNYVCSIETWNYDCQFKDVILKLPQHSVTFGPVPNSKQKLAFQNSTLEYLPKSLIDAFPRMQVLNLEGLQIREIDSNTFQTASELLELYMQNNQLKEIKSNTFSGARKLELLDLSYNAIESNRIAPNFLFAVPNLQQFKINSNRISQLPLSQQNYNLQYITASENSITHIEADQFRNNYQLSELDFSYNRLEYFDLQQLDDKQNLLLINVNHNYLRAFHIPQYVKTLFA